MKSALRILLALALVVSATAVYAGETGSVSGTVKDGTGAPVPGATVKISGPQMPAGWTVVSRGTGTYNFPKLLPGSYTVEASLQGLGKAAKKVDVSVDNDHQIELVLIQRATGEVVVTASTAEVDKKSTEVNFNFTSTELQPLALARTYQGLLNLIPGAPADTSGSGYVGVAGGTRQDNKYLIDGVNITNVGYGNLAVDTNSLDIADVNVKTGAITAEFGRTNGVIVNAVTKSGTNEYHGGVFFEGRPASFQAANAHLISRDTDVYGGAASLGFPILKDVFFGYVSGRYTSTTVSGQSATVGGITTTQPDTKTRDQDYFGKVTAYLGQSFLLNAAFRDLPSKTTDGFDSAYDLATAGWNSETKSNVSNVTADWFVSKDSYLEAKYVHVTQNPAALAQTVITDRPLTIDTNNLGKYGAYFDNTGRNGGNVGVYPYVNDATVYRRDEVKLTASQFLDLGPTQHQLKVGGGAEFSDFDFYRQSNGWGQLTYSSTTEVRARYYANLPKQIGRARTYSAFLQDTLSWGRLSANLGVLANYDDFAQVMLDGTRVNFMTFGWDKQIQPRLGLVYNAELLKGDKFYTNYGTYTGLDQKNAARSHAPARIRDDYSFFSRTTGQWLRDQIRGSSTGHQIPQGLDAPYYQEWILGYSAPVTRDVTADLYYQYRNLKNPLEDTPIDLNNYGGAGWVQNFPDARRVYRGITLDVTKRYSNGWYANVNYTYSKLYGNFDEDFALASFSSSSRLEDEPGEFTDDPLRYGRLGQDRPHVFKILASYDLPLGFTVGGFFRVQSGTPWQAVGRSSNYTDRYLEQAGSNRYPTWTNLDFLLAYVFKLGGDMSLRLEGRVQNVFNTQTALSVNTLKYNDPYVDGTPPSTLGPQQTKQPNPLFGTETSWTSPRRFVLTALLNF